MLIGMLVLFEETDDEMETDDDSEAAHEVSLAWDCAVRNLWPKLWLSLP